MICSGVYDRFDNYTNFTTVKKPIDLFKIIFFIVVIYLLLFLQILPISIKSNIYDPFFDIYLLSWKDYFNYLISPLKFLKNTQLYEVGEKFPLEKADVIGILDEINKINNKLKINIYGGYFSENINDIELIKPNCNPLLILLSLPYSFSQNTKIKHDGIVPLKSILGFQKINKQISSVEYDVEIDKQIKDLFQDRFKIRILNIDHFDIIGTTDDVYTDDIIWEDISDYIY